MERVRLSNPKGLSSLRLSDLQSPMEGRINMGYNGKGTLYSTSTIEHLLNAVISANDIAMSKTDIVPTFIDLVVYWRRQTSKL